MTKKRPVWIKVYSFGKKYFAVRVEKEYPVEREYIAITKTFDEMLLILTECHCEYKFIRKNGHIYFGYDYNVSYETTDKIRELIKNTKAKAK